MVTEVVDLTDSPEQPACKRARRAAPLRDSITIEDDEVQIVSPTAKAAVCAVQPAAAQQGIGAGGVDDDFILTGARAAAQRRLISAVGRMHERDSSRSVRAVITRRSDSLSPGEIKGIAWNADMPHQRQMCGLHTFVQAGGTGNASVAIRLTLMCCIIVPFERTHATPPDAACVHVSTSDCLLSAV